MRVARLESGRIQLWPAAGLTRRLGDRRRSGGNAHVEAVDLRGDLRKFGDRQFVAVGEHHGAEHRVLELAHVARPVVGAQQRMRLVGEAADALALFGAEAREEAAREIGDVASRARAAGEW